MVNISFSFFRELHINIFYVVIFTAFVLEKILLI